MLTHIHPSRPRFTCRTRPVFNGSQLVRLKVRGRPRPARCPELLCPHEGLPRTTRRLAPRQRVLPLLHHSYELMRQTKFLPASSVAPIPRGLCRLSSVPAARWPFPTLSPPLFPQMLGPLPRRFSRCTYPLLPRRHRPSPAWEWLGNTQTVRTATSVRGSFSGLQTVLHVQASGFARHPGRSYRRASSRLGAAVAFTSEHMAVCYLPALRIC